MGQWSMDQFPEVIYLLAKYQNVLLKKNLSEERLPWPNQEECVRPCSSLWHQPHVSEAVLRSHISPVKTFLGQIYQSVFKPWLLLHARGWISRGQIRLQLRHASPTAQWPKTYLYLCFPVSNMILLFAYWWSKTRELSNNSVGNNVPYFNNVFSVLFSWPCCDW